LDRHNVGLSLMVGNDDFRNKFLSSFIGNVPKAIISTIKNRKFVSPKPDISKSALAALNCLDALAHWLRIESIEFAFPYPYGNVAQLNEQVGQKVSEMMDGRKTTVHLPMAPLHTVEGVLEVTAGLEYGLAHGATQFVVHPGEVHKGRFGQKITTTALDFAKAKESGLAALERMLDTYKHHKIIVGIENLAGPVPYGKHPNEFDYLFGKRGNMTVGWCVDTGHLYNALAHNHSNGDLINLIKSYYKNDQIVEMHLVDTAVSNGPDKHCVLGQGNVPLDDMLKSICGFTGPIIAEVNPKDFQASWNWVRADR